MNAISDIKVTSTNLTDILPHGFSYSQIANAITTKSQELILLPTEKCNFRCTYCYEDFEIGRMTETTQRAIELFLDRRIPQLKKLTFSWFGGEPLLAKDVVLRLSRYAYELCTKNNVIFNGNITTNAYLLDSTFMEELVGLNLTFYQITLDGWEEAHDVLRQRADGKGTFDVIWANLLAMRNLTCQFEVSIRIHVRRDNFENLKILMIEIAHAFGGDNRFKLDFQHLRDLGGSGGETIVDPVSLDELAGIEQKLKSIVIAAVNKKLGLQDEETPSPGSNIENPVAHANANAKAGESAGSRSSAEYVEGEPYICYAARPNSLLIRANGRIGKCTVALTDSRNDLGSLLPDGTIDIDNKKLQPWIRGLGTLSPESAGCPMVGMPQEHAIPNRGVSSKIVPILAI